MGSVASLPSAGIRARALVHTRVRNQALGSPRTRKLAQPADLPDAPTHPVFAAPEVPAVRATAINQFGVAVDTGKVFPMTVVGTDVPRLVCNYFNDFWRLMARADPAASRDPQKVFGADYRLFFSRFCAVNLQGEVEHGAAEWHKRRRAFAEFVLSRLVSDKAGFNAEVLAREMFARYIVGPTAACVSTAQADGPEPFDVHLSSLYKGKGREPMRYVEVHSSARALQAAPLFGTLKPVDGVWKGFAWTACRALPWAYPARTCDTSATTRWRKTDPYIAL